MKIHSLLEQHMRISQEIKKLQEMKLDVEGQIYIETAGNNYADDWYKLVITKSESKKWDQEKLKLIQVEFPQYVDIDYAVDLRKLKSADPALVHLVKEALTTKENKPNFKVEKV